MFEIIRIVGVMYIEVYQPWNVGQVVYNNLKIINNSFCLEGFSEAGMRWHCELVQ